MMSNGVHPVPKGKVATVITYLEMTARPELRAAALPDGVSFHQIKANVDWFRDIFERVGSHEWLWYGRRRIDNEALAEILADPHVEHYTLRREGRDEALVELDFRQHGTCELIYFGLTPSLIGTGCGRYLMNAAIKRAWSQPIQRFHLHTCTHDSPQALDFYRRSGFVPVRQAIGIDDDPRLSGLLPRTAGPHVPVFDP
ncbi:MAG: GNAT family N-acetyltransferase [Pseudomonadota bacterium]